MFRWPAQRALSWSIFAGANRNCNLQSYGYRKLWLDNNRKIPMNWRFDRTEGQKEGEKHSKIIHGSDSDQVDEKEGEDGWEKGRREVGILVPAALVLQARLTSAQPAHGCSPLPISTDGLLGASRSRKKYETTVRLLLSFLLHTSHKPWPSQSKLWRVKPLRYWPPAR